jgi:hypothetical protein
LRIHGVLAVLFAFTALCQSAAAGAPPLPGRAARRAQFALVVGYNGTQNPAAASLHYADDDAVATHRLLQQAGVQAVLLTELDQDSRALYPDVQVDGAPTLAAMLAHFSMLHTAMETARLHGNEVHFTFVYSGHGDVQNGVGYVELMGGRLTRTKLYNQILARSPATFNHVIVDACKAYFLAFDRGPGGQRVPVHGMLPIHAEVLRRTGFILSTSSGGNTHEWSPYQGGVFSHELRSAWRGAADLNSDGAITYSELGAYFPIVNAGVTNARFRPDVLVRPPAGGSWDQAALTWTTVPPMLVLDAGAQHIYAEAVSGERVFDVHPRDDGAPLRMRLPKDTVSYLHDANNTWERMVAGDALFSQLVPAPYGGRTRGSFDVAAEHLFAHPFGVAEWSAFVARPVVPEPPWEAYAPAVIPSKLPLWAGAAAATVGMGLDAWVLVQNAQGQNASQVRREDLNNAMRHEHFTALGLYGAALAAVSYWAAEWLMLNSDSPTDPDG